MNRLEAIRWNNSQRKKNSFQINGSKTEIIILGKKEQENQYRLSFIWKNNENEIFWGEVA